MVTNFSLIRTPRILFGSGEADRISTLISPGWKHILILTGSKSHENNPVFETIHKDLEKTGIRLGFEKIENEPSPKDIDNIARNSIYHDVDAVIAIGGGSVLDAGKAVSAMIPLNDSVLNYLEGVGHSKHPGTKKFFIAIPTTSGTGSEATSNAVLSQTGINGFKRSLRHESFVPDIALVDPRLTINCPPSITARSGMDAFTQLLESYVSVKSNSLTDAFALDGIRCVHKSLMRAFTNGDDLEARTDMAYAALLSGITLANAGLGLIHGFASSVGGFFEIPHGTVCGTMMGVVNRYNIKALLKQTEQTVSHRKYAETGKVLSGEAGKSIEWYLNFTANYIDELTEKLLLKRLSEFGIQKEDIGRIAEVTDHKANPVKFQKEDLVDMLKIRL
ncbi:MAG TPA: iron-containing alcohol dehydrogenase [Bacteroidales bacterium]|nr:iron-containing alcohol dehydrogenase [Bacteroidales bacterium]